MKKPYCKDLTTPMAPFQRTSSLAKMDEPYRDLQRIKKEKRQKFNLLLEHYGIAQDDAELLKKLVWTLINDHVPGFQFEKSKLPGSLIKYDVPDFQLEKPKRKVGRPKKWTSEKKLELELSVFLELLDGAPTEAEALRRLVDKGKVSKDRKRPESARNRLDEARKDDLVKTQQYLLGQMLRTHSFDEIRCFIETKLEILNDE